MVYSDFTTFSRNAIEFAVSKFGRQLECLILINAVESGHSHPSLLIYLEDILLDRAQRSMEEDVAFARKVTANLGAEVKFVLKKGSPLHAIRDAVSEEKVDLVVLPAIPGPAQGQNGVSTEPKLELADFLKVPVLMMPRQSV